MKMVEQYIPNPLKRYKFQIYCNKKIIKDNKCVGNVVSKNLLPAIMNVNFPTNVPAVAAKIQSTLDHGMATVLGKENL